MDGQVSEGQVMQAIQQEMTVAFLQEFYQVGPSGLCVEDKTELAAVSILGASGGSWGVPAHIPSSTCAWCADCAGQVLQGLHHQALVLPQQQRAGLPGAMLR